jgi:hypothetical protein
VFDLFERRRTINGVLVYLAAHDVRLPYRLRGGPGKGELAWRRPNRHTLGEMLTDPAYAQYGSHRSMAGPCWRSFLGEQQRWPASPPAFRPASASATTSASA